MNPEVVESLIEMYEEAFDRIFNRVTKNIASGGYTKRDISLMKSINAEIMKLSQQNIAIADQIVKPLYNKTREETANLLKDSFEVQGGFDRVHTEAINLTQASLVKDLTTKNLIVGKQIEKLLKTKGIKLSQQIQLGVLKKKEAIKEFVQEMGDQFHVTYKNGSKVHIKDYAKMSIRTTINSSMARATINTNLEYGNDLVRMSWHSTSCPVCSPYQGKVYSINGDTKGYPLLSEINNGAVSTYGVTHPQCRHRFTPYVRELDDNAKKVQEFSNSGFDDNRTETSKTRYDNRQKYNRYKRDMARFKQEKDVLSKLPKTPERDREIESLNRKIKLRKNKIKHIKDWEVDNPKNDENLFTTIPPK